jgi:hypothetical protein
LKTVALCECFALHCSKFSLYKYSASEFIFVKKTNHVNQPNLSPEEAKDLILDEEARPTKKMTRPTVPTSESKSTHKKIKGIRKV